MTDLLIERDQRILTLRFNRPDKKNALTHAMYDAAAAALKSAGEDPEVRVVLFAGQPDCFTAGNDLGEFLKSPPASTDSPVGRFMQALFTFEKPVVAAPCGLAVGIGVTLLLHCDLIYCGQATRFHMPFVSLGACPEFAASYVLPRLMGHPRAAELLMLARPFNAEEAVALGIVNAALPNTEVESHARAKALELAAQPPNALKVTKRLMRQWSRETAERAIAVEGEHFMPMLTQPEAREAFMAFAQKRKPDFSRF